MGNDNTKALSGMDMTTGSIPVKILKCSIPPVSYTHLDVYKRQVETQSAKEHCYYKYAA